VVQRSVIALLMPSEKVEISSRNRRVVKVSAAAFEPATPACGAWRSSSPKHRNGDEFASNCANLLARPAGIEPATPGLEGLDDSSHGVSDSSKSLEVQRVTKGDLSRASPGIAPDSRSFGAIVVQADRPGSEAATIGPFLTVREVAARLRVSTATVYSLCESGGLSHVRVSNSIRVAERSLRQYLEKVSKGPR
jgi:excisionase family DNA binding protein